MPFLTRKTAGDLEKGGILGSQPPGDPVLWDVDSYQASGGSKRAETASRSHDAFMFGHVSRCASTECAGGWRAPWKSRGRPVFEGQWGCSGRCISALIRVAIRREIGDSASVSNAPHRHRIPLGLLMLAQGWITQEQLRRGLEAQRFEGTGRIGDWLKSECGLAPEQLTRGLGMQWGCPVLSTDRFVPEEMVLILPKLFVEEFGLLPLRIAISQMIYLGSAMQLDASVALALEQMTGLTVQSGVVEEDRFTEAKRGLLASRGVESHRERVANSEDLVSRMTSLLERRQPAASRFVRVHQYYWLRMWLEPAAMSDKGYLAASTEDVVDYIFTIGAGD